MTEAFCVEENAGVDYERIRMERAVAWVEDLLEENCWTTILERDAPGLSGRKWKTIGAIRLFGRNQKSVRYSA